MTFKEHMCLVRLLVGKIPQQEVTNQETETETEVWSVPNRHWDQQKRSAVQSNIQLKYSNPDVIKVWITSFSHWYVINSMYTCK